MAFLQPTFTNGTSIVPDLQSDPFITGFNYQYLTATTFSISPGAARAYTSDFVIQYPATLPGLPSSIIVDTTTIGAGGCYPISAALAAPTNDTSFGIYAIGKSSGTTDGSLNNNVSASVVVATGNNFLPAGYDSWRRIGTVYITAGTNNQILMFQDGFDLNRNYSLQSFVPIVTGGASTSLALVDVSAVEGPCNPFFTSQVGIQTVFTPAAAGNQISFAPSNVTGGNTVRFAGQVAAVAIIETFNMTPSIVSGDAAIYYAVTAGTMNAHVNGFQESLGLQAI